MDRYCSAIHPRVLARNPGLPPVSDRAGFVFHCGCSLEPLTLDEIREAVLGYDRTFPDTAEADGWPLITVEKLLKELCEAGWMRKV